MSCCSALLNWDGRSRKDIFQVEMQVRVLRRGHQIGYYCCCRNLLHLLKYLCFYHSPSCLVRFKVVFTQINQFKM